jgi:hypothetical protein
MRPLLISLAGLMVLVIIVGIGIAALRDATETWAGIVLLLTLGLLAVSILGVLYRNGGRRAWWVGFALFGWGFAALTLAPWSKPEKLPTRVLLNSLYARMSHRKVVTMEPFAASAGLDEGQFIVLDPSPSHESLPGVPQGSDAVFAIGSIDLKAFRAIGHCLFALVAGVVGGFVARWFYSTREVAGRRDGT